MPEDWVPLCQRENLSYFELFAITLCQFSVTLVWIPFAVLLNPLMQKFRLSKLFSGMIYLIGPVSGLTISPLIGVYSDNTTSKYGRRRVWMVFGEVLVLIGMCFVVLCDKMANEKIYICAFIFIGQAFAMFGANIVAGPGRAMCSDVTPARQQVFMSNLCTTQASIAGIVSHSIGALQITKRFNISFDAEQFVLMVTQVIGIIALAISCYYAKEEQISVKKGGNIFNEIVSSLSGFGMGMWLMGIAHFFNAIGCNQFGVQFCVFIARQIYGGDTEDKRSLYDDGIAFGQRLMSIQTISGVIFGFANHIVTDKIGLSGVWSLGLACGVIGLVLFSLVLDISRRYFYVIPGIFFSYYCVVMGSILPAVFSLYLDKDKLACIYGVFNVFFCLGQLFAIYLFQIYLSSIPYVEPSHILVLSSVFVFGALIAGFKGIRLVEKQSSRPDEEESLLPHNYST